MFAFFIGLCLGVLVGYIISAIVGAVRPDRSLDEFRKDVENMKTNSAGEAAKEE